MANKKALFIGRFQPYHLGHLYAVRYLLKRYGYLIIAIGSSQEDYTARNPLTEKERIEMLEKVFRQIGLTKKQYKIVSIPDINTNSLWPDYVAKKTGRFDIVVTASPFTKLLFEDAGYMVDFHPLLRRKFYSGTEIRNRILRNKDWDMLVSASVFVYLQKLDLKGRLKKINQTDNPYLG
ncbi:MAG: nicotinamide-nucleotide adenylyltransferase [Patescibacteria group bacterium]|nr:nicotinamide-nucleotide adenylyltransferase [Patescibacteria group bacterium]